uniref:Uncharacterized protein n=1 Tax=Monodon monoceros TaxID=40151 RepID=A0A8C6F931_MONMO
MGRRRGNSSPCSHLLRIQENRWSSEWPCPPWARRMKWHCGIERAKVRPQSQGGQSFRASGRELGCEICQAGAGPEQSWAPLAEPGGSYVTSWALSWGSRGSRSVRRQRRKLSSVTPGCWLISIRSRWVQASRPTSATRTFRGLKN